ncbi:hypothetical protein HS041_22550 [Planomonospora sp. ID67723]|uniref:hypothetical protein n=1 Tax=Planomonospora sp. ID67723 TaxID=2738134 RepID=UPI0018C41CE3|nr:hypothetical protein [Planomonospora sp. ID67723]MBG0830546.1 hypothetical protein [Planomonospora sp. ID67723]
MSYLDITRIERLIRAERARQLVKFGPQNHPDRDPLENNHAEGVEYGFHAQRWKEINAQRAQDGRTAWDGILLEEVYEALTETDPAKLREELIQVAAVCCTWIEALDRRPS